MKIAVVGFGNILMSDEGIGIYIIEELQKNYLMLTTRHSLEFIDGGTAAIDVLLSLKDVDKLIIVDAVKNGGAPGDIYKFQNFTISQSSISGMQKNSLHDLNIIDALKIAEKLGVLPKQVVFIGVEPKEVEPKMQLSEEIRSKIPEIIKTVLCEVKQ